MDLLEREAALADLDLARYQATSGQGRVALVSGEAGIGKTSLVDCFADYHQRNLRVLWGGCDALSAPRPLGPVHDIAAQVGGTLANVLLGAASSAVVFGAVLAELQRLPTIAIVEDVHWADDATLDVLRYVGRRIGRTSALLVLTYRTDEISPSGPLRRLLGDLASSDTALRIQLPPLSERAVATLVGDRAIDALALHRQSGGNPFFVTEVLANTAPGLPSTIRDAVLGRTARLSCAARSLLEAATVAGPRVESWLLASIAPDQRHAVDECLGAGVLLEHADGFAFRHELARQAVLDAIPAARRAELHRRVLDALESLPAGRAELARLAQHAKVPAICAPSRHTFLPPRGRPRPPAPIAPRPTCWHRCFAAPRCCRMATSPGCARRTPWSATTSPTCLPRSRPGDGRSPSGTTRAIR
jgi:predicted ATPase